METKKLIRKANFLLASAIIGLSVLLTVASLLLAPDAKREGKEPAILSKEEILKQGEYLVSVSGCHDCHSPKIMGPLGPEPDPKRLLSGHPSEDAVPYVDTDALKSWVLFNQNMTAIAGPWGVSFSANITSDDSGVGNWSEEQFFRAIREGKYKGLEGGRMLLPPMPWPVYRNMKDEDLRAIFAYLKTTKPIRNIVPAPISREDVFGEAEKNVRLNAGLNSR